MKQLKLLDFLPFEGPAVETNLFVGALGYENRAVAMAKKFSEFSTRRVALGFDHNQSLSYESNKSWFRANDFEIFENLNSVDFEEVFKTVWKTSTQAIGPDVKIKAMIDISCFDRNRLASILNVTLASKISIDILFVYSIARFRPYADARGRNEFAGPVHKNFAGAFADPSKPVALIAGLGYEQGKVMGAAEYIQASRVIAFIPESSSNKYTPAVISANELLLREISKSDVIYYKVEEPRRTLAVLDSVVRGLSESFNVVLLLGGPKMFGLCGLLMHAVDHRVSIWRVSTGSAPVHSDVIASRYSSGARLISSNSQDSSEEGENGIL